MERTYDDAYSGSLYERARQLLMDDERSLLDIHKQSGLPFYWLRKIHSGTIPDPSVNRIQFLFEFLSNTELDVRCTN